jgi:cell division protein ZapA
LPKPRPYSIEVEIYDQRYSIVLQPDMQEADVRKVAEDVDERMRMISRATNTPDSLKIAVLTALHLAQELRDKGKTSEVNDILKRSDELSSALEELLSK